MGSDKDAVVDANCGSKRAGLCIADASIMPRITFGNTAHRH
jgi:choline dehydrogenase-like flavoprotein